MRHEAMKAAFHNGGPCGEGRLIHGLFNVPDIVQFFFGTIIEFNQDVVSQRLLHFQNS
jgi:hypothetical protein